MKQRRQASISIAALLLCLSLTFHCCLAANPEPQSPLSQGIALYEKKNYAGAQAYLLKAVHGEFKDVALAHYYLANSLMQTSKVNAALEEYERCYKLAPYSSFSGYCRMMLIRHGRTPDENDANHSRTRPLASQPAKASAPPQTSGRKDSDAAELPVSKPIADQELRALSSRLPRPVFVQKETPPASEILAGNIFHRASFLSESENRKSRAAEKLEQARQALARAESLTHSFIPSARRFGESDDEFRSRRADAEKTVSELLDPFRESVKAAETAFQTESSLFESCLNASRGYL
ncbi:MAG: hypothetical protein C0507_14515 [Cyanobacteria bacterium PR.3.49]|nr:hypothetical protein [Cyanobacteria bacterium PR.3.49]